MEMKDFFKELFEYSHHFNQEIAKILADNSDKVSAKSKNLFSHLISAHQIWNSRVLSDEKPFEVWQVHSTADYKEINSKNFERSLKVIEAYNLSEIITYNTSKGDPFQNTVRDILFHIINHSTYHRAQIATELKAVGIEPVFSDWVMYKR